MNRLFASKLPGKLRTALGGVVLLVVLGAMNSAANAADPNVGAEDQPPVEGGYTNDPIPPGPPQVEYDDTMRAPPGTYERIVAFAAERVNKSRVGDGKSATLVLRAFEEASADIADGGVILARLNDPNNLNWGAEVPKSKIRPGHIIQFYNCRFEGEGKGTKIPPRHTAIVEKVDGKIVTLLEQGYAAKKKKKSYVRRRELDLTWNLVKADNKDPQQPRFVVFAPMVLY